MSGDDKKSDSNVSTTAAMFTTLKMLFGKPDSAYQFRCPQRQDLHDKLKGNFHSVSTAVGLINVGLDKERIPLGISAKEEIIAQAQSEKKLYDEGEDRLTVEAQINHHEARISHAFYRESTFAVTERQRAFNRGGQFLHTLNGFNRYLQSELTPDTDPVAIERHHPRRK